MEGEKRTLTVKGLRIPTRCDTVEQFIAKFHRFCEHGAVFIPNAKRDVGVDTAFSFDLATGQSALCGLGTVLDHFTTSDNRFGRPGIVVGVSRLQRDTQRVYEDMLVARAAVATSEHEPEPEPRPTTTPGMLAAAGDRATPTPWMKPRTMTGAIEIVDSVTVRAATLAAPKRPRSAPLVAVTAPLAATAAAPAVLPEPAEEPAAAPPPAELASSVLSPPMLEPIAPPSPGALANASTTYPLEEVAAAPVAATPMSSAASVAVASAPHKLALRRYLRIGAPVVAVAAIGIAFVGTRGGAPPAESPSITAPASGSSAPAEKPSETVPTAVKPAAAVAPTPAVPPPPTDEVAVPKPVAAKPVAAKPIAGKAVTKKHSPKHPAATTKKKPTPPRKCTSPPCS